MLLVVKNVFIDVETREERQPFEFIDVTDERAVSLIERDLAIAVPLIEVKQEVEPVIDEVKTTKKATK